MYIPCAKHLRSRACVQKKKKNEREHNFARGNGQRWPLPKGVDASDFRSCLCILRSLQFPALFFQVFFF